jgi:hypothetical protein
MYIHTGAQQIIIFNCDILSNTRHILLHYYIPILLGYGNIDILMKMFKIIHYTKTSKPVLSVLLQASFSCSTFDYKEHSVDTRIATCTDFYYSSYFLKKMTTLSFCS